MFRAWVATLVLSALCAGCKGESPETSQPPPGESLDSVRQTAPIVYRDISELPQYRDFERTGGTLIGQTSGAPVRRRFAFGSIRRGDERRIILKRVLPQNGSRVSYQFLAELDVSSVDSTQGVGYGTCWRNGASNDLIVAVFEYEDVEYYDKVSRAWLADTTNFTFEPIDPSGVECVNDGYGI
jgi:hypothetical protein